MNKKRYYVSYLYGQSWVRYDFGNEEEVLKFRSEMTESTEFFQVVYGRLVDMVPMETVTRWGFENHQHDYFDEDKDE